MSRIAQIRLLLLVAILLVFGRTLGHDFVDWDDRRLIFSNPNIAEPTVNGLLRHWNPRDNGGDRMYDPLVFTLWWSIAHVAQLDSPDLMDSKLNPYLFHAANLLVHWLSACVVLEILRRLKLGDWPSAAGALVFAIHPIQTEAVAWATAMKDLLGGLFSLLCIWRFMVALNSPGQARRDNYLAATLLFAAALLAKPSAVILPLIVISIDRIVQHRPWKEIARWIWPWFVMALGVTLLAMSVQPTAGEVSNPLLPRPMIALDSLAFYLYKIILPIRLTFDYGRSPTAVLADPSHPLYWTWIFPAALAFILWRSHRRVLYAAGLIFVLGVLPVLGLQTFVFQYYSTVADRYVYVSMLAIAIVVAWWVGRYPNRRTLAAVMTVLVVLGTLSFVQAGRWQNSETLYQWGLSLNKSKAVHYVIYGQYKDRLAGPQYRLAAAAAKQGDLIRANQFAQQAESLVQQAIEQYRTAIRVEPTQTAAYDGLVPDLIRVNQIPQAIDVVQQWIQIKPNVPEEKRESPGSLQSTLGMLYLRNRQFPQAVEMLRQSMQIHPDPDVEKSLQFAEKLAAGPATATSPSGNQ